jgi:F-type H+-transporting ATPase subunit delta
MASARVAKLYAAALMEIGEAQQLSDTIAQDLETVGAFLQASRQLQLLLASPVVTPAKKKAVFRELFGPRVGKEAMTFLLLLIQKNRGRLLPEVITQYRALRDTHLGIITVDIRSAVSVTPAQETRLKEELERSTRKTVRFRNVLDETIKGGLMVKIGDTVLDGSIRRQLERLRLCFIEGEAVGN